MVLNIDELNEELNLALTAEYDDSIGGFLLDISGSVPGEDENSSVGHENLEFKAEKSKTCSIIAKYIYFNSISIPSDFVNDLI
ncbi:Mg2+/Co2+ transporter CorC [Anaerosolibacter carboniphilus]|uniref:Mg2+/Co2+ transporter CorC n=1 Tax=Anaerosolibacter carboniphilus TaxID=1417629 RepID=A0A841KUW3_9FIRM|nr:Mg2+/Co2+ transporter CorC [Anaerosolibacter carboniphilus]